MLDIRNRINNGSYERLKTTIAIYFLVNPRAYFPYNSIFVY